MFGRLSIAAIVQEWAFFSLLSFFFFLKYSVIASHIVIHQDGNKGGDKAGGGSGMSYDAVKAKDFGCTTSAVSCLFLLLFCRLWKWVESSWHCQFEAFLGFEVRFKVSQTVATPIISWPLLHQIANHFFSFYIFTNKKYNAFSVLPCS